MLSILIQELKKLERMDTDTTQADVLYHTCLHGEFALQVEHCSQLASKYLISPEGILLPTEGLGYTVVNSVPDSPVWISGFIQTAVGELLFY